MCNNTKAGMAEINIRLTAMVKGAHQGNLGVRLLTVCASAHEGSNPSPSAFIAPIV